jgi:hypothetical protein
MAQRCSSLSYGQTSRIVGDIVISHFSFHMQERMLLGSSLLGKYYELAGLQMDRSYNKLSKESPKAWLKRWLSNRLISLLGRLKSPHIRLLVEGEGHGKTDENSVMSLTYMRSLKTHLGTPQIHSRIEMVRLEVCLWMRKGWLLTQAFSPYRTCGGTLPLAEGNLLARSSGLHMHKRRQV